MKKAALVLVLLICVPLVAIAGWSWMHARQVEAELEKYISWNRSQRLVAIDFAVKAPAETPAGQILYLSGSAPALGNWDAAGVPLTRGSDGAYHARVELMSGIEQQFKVTRGTWGTVERGPGGAEMTNHTFVAPATQPSPISVEVATWVDGGKSVPGRVTLTGDIRYHKKFHSAILNNDRTLVVYLPPGYEKEAARRFGVLYMQDGQNLFDESTAFAGIEWGVDETAQRLITAGRIEPVIIVGIYNTENRSAEFLPASLAGPGQTALAERYARMLVEEVKPFIDATYRTLPDQKHTGLAGSSMGALVSLYTVKAYPDTFSTLALLTPWLRTPAKDVVSDLAGQAGFLKGTRVFMTQGSAGGANYPGADPVADARSVGSLLESAGLKRDVDYAFTEFAGGEHTEAAWAGQVQAMLLFLYPR